VQCDVTCIACSAYRLAMAAVSSTTTFMGAARCLLRSRVGACRRSSLPQIRGYAYVASAEVRMTWVISGTFGRVAMSM
jgi:hypothetical protein